MKTFVLSINGMVCDGCVEHVAHGLKMVRGVQQVEVDLISRTARVQHDERVCKVNDLVGAVQHVGYQVDSYAALEANV